jgi:hypothetical protein
LKTTLIAALALAVTTAIAVPALAHENPQDFPMPAATFQKHVERRLERARARMEERIAEHNLTDAQAKEVRARFDTVAASVGVEVQKAVADGTVTLDEARAVRAVARQLRGHRGNHAQGESS